MSTIYVSKSGNDVNNGSTYLLSKLTISAALTTAGATTSTIIVGSGLYNEKLTIIAGAIITFYADGVVILDGTSIASGQAIYIGFTGGSANFFPYTTGGCWILQNHVATSLIGVFSSAAVSYTNMIFISNSNVNAWQSAAGAGIPTFTNCVFSGFTTVVGGSSQNMPMSFYNCTFYGGTTAILTGLSAPVVIISQCIFSNFTTAWNLIVAPTFSNNNIYYNVTNYKVGASTYVNQSQVQAAGYDLNSLWQNPNFVDAANNVFYLTSNPNVTNNAYLYYGAYPYGLTRGNVYNPDNKWLITGSFDNSGWYNPDGNITMVSSLFQLTTGATGVIWSPVYDLTSSQTISQFNVDALQVWGTNMVDTTKTDVRPNYQTSEIRASATSFNQNDGVIAWTELKNRIPFTTQGSTNLTGRYVQLRLTLRNDDVAA